eukprot:7387350-Prymnesium_polylepis.2
MGRHRVHCRAATLLGHPSFIPLGEWRALPTAQQKLTDAVVVVVQRIDRAHRVAHHRVARRTRGDGPRPAEAHHRRAPCRTPPASRPTVATPAGERTP